MGGQTLNFFLHGVTGGLNCSFYTLAKIAVTF